VVNTKYEFLVSFLTLQFELTFYQQNTISRIKKHHLIARRVLNLNYLSHPELTKNIKVNDVASFYFPILVDPFFDATDDGGCSLLNLIHPDFK
jgi:hypothetical protein